MNQRRSLPSDFFSASASLLALGDVSVYMDYPIYLTSFVSYRKSGYFNETFSASAVKVNMFHC